MKTKQFNLEEYKKNPSHKVVTRDGRPVRIICTDKKARSGNIVGLVGEDEPLIYVWNNDGKHIVSGIPDNDLFFADEEDDLTEFEKSILVFIDKAKQGVLNPKNDEDVKGCAKSILNLACKQLKQETIEALRTEYEKGRADVLQEFPKTEDTKAFQEGVKEGRRLERQEFDSELGEAYNQGREDVLKELPRWKPLKNGHLFKDGMQNVCFEGGGVATCLIYGDKYILISDLEKLPKEE